MRCLLLCSGAGEPTPVGASVQSLPSGHNRPWFCCPAREHRSPPCAKGGQHGRAMQGGLQSQANDSAGCCDRVREHRLTVRTPDREHRLGAEARRQSLSRRSPTAPFAQGSLLCCPGHNRPWFCCPAREHRSPPCGGVAPLPYQGGLQSQVNDSAGCCDRVREHRLAVPTPDPPCAKGGQHGAAMQGGL